MLEISGSENTNTITTVQKDNVIIEQRPKILTPRRTEYGKKIRKNYENGLIKESRHNMTQLEPRADELSNTITTVQKDNLLYDKNAIRKLTERECWRLFGFTDDDVDKVKAIGISKTQMYKQAGNSIVVNVLEAILYELFINNHPNLYTGFSPKALSFIKQINDFREVTENDKKLKVRNRKMQITKTTTKNIM